MDRHCAYCNVLIPVDKVKLCGKCGRRAYCSRRCQTVDWKPKKNGGLGQGHVSWCGLPAGEQDLDWVVKNEEDGKKGLIAKRFFPAKSRILVDAFKGDDFFREDGFYDEYKVDRALTHSNNIAHSCNGSVSVEPDPTFNINVICAKRDIQPGEELTFNIVIYNDSLGPKSDPEGGTPFPQSFEDCRRILKSCYGIVCPQNCFCQDEEMDKLITEGRKIMADIMAQEGMKTEPSRDIVNMHLANVETLLGIWDKMQGSWIGRAEILELGWRLAAQQKTTLALADKYIKEARDIYATLLHPKSMFVYMVKLLISIPTSYDKYLILDRLELME